MRVPASVASGARRREAAGRRYDNLAYITTGRTGAAGRAELAKGLGKQDVRAQIQVFCDLNDSLALDRRERVRLGAILTSTDVTRYHALY